VTLELLGGLLRDAERLGDETLAKAVAVYQEQLLLVLAQQAGSVADLGVPARSQSPDGKPATKPASSAHRKPDTVTPTPTTPGETAPAAVTESGGGRRRR
jgi:hypothetical protein